MALSPAASIRAPKASDSKEGKSQGNQGRRALPGSQLTMDVSSQGRRPVVNFMQAVRRCHSKGSRFRIQP